MILELHVQPGAKRTEFAGKHGGRVPKKSVTIASGLRSRRKRVLIG